jgi:tellurite methyltransferase
MPNGSPDASLDTAALRDKWDRAYRAAPENAMPQAAQVLRDYAHLLPRTGRALDLAAGLGGNALFLAQQGLEVAAYDISAVGLERLGQLAAGQGVRVSAEARDVVRHPPEAERFDVIVVSRFLERSLVPAIVRALRPEGLLFYQTFIREKAQPGGPSNPDYLLGTGELLALFRELRLLAYREEGRVGDLAQGFRNEALLVGQKPAISAPPAPHST